MTNPKENVQGGPLAEYWYIFVEGLIASILTFYLIGLGGPASIFGILILLGEIGAIVYSASQGEFKLLIVFILANNIGK